MNKDNSWTSATSSGMRNFDGYFDVDVALDTFLTTSFEETLFREGFQRADDTDRETLEKKFDESSYKSIEFPEGVTTDLGNDLKEDIDILDLMFSSDDSTSISSSSAYYSTFDSQSMLSDNLCSEYMSLSTSYCDSGSSIDDSVDLSPQFHTPESKSYKDVLLTTSSQSVCVNAPLPMSSDMNTPKHGSRDRSESPDFILLAWTSSRTGLDANNQRISESSSMDSGTSIGPYCGSTDSNGDLLESSPLRQPRRRRQTYQSDNNDDESPNLQFSPIAQDTDPLISIEKEKNFCRLGDMEDMLRMKKRYRRVQQNIQKLRKRQFQRRNI